MDDVDTEELVIPDVTSIESGTPVIESKKKNKQVYKLVKKTMSRLNSGLQEKGTF